MNTQEPEPTTPSDDLVARQEREDRLLEEIDANLNKARGHLHRAAERRTQ